MIRKLATVFGTIGIFVAGVAFIALMGSLRPKIEPKEPDVIAPTVFYAEAAPQPVTLDVRAQGEVRPRTDINLTAQVAGRIVEIADAFVDGGAFQEGDTLVRIEDADYRAQVASARSRLAQAEQALRMEEAESALALRDYEDLGREGDPSALTLREPQLAQAQANFEAARAELRAAELNLARTRVMAPFKGRVRERVAGLGQFIQPGAQIGRIFSTDVAEIRLLLNDGDLAKLGLPIAFVASEASPGPRAALSATIAGERHEWEARIARTDGAIDPATRQIGAIAVVDDPYGDGASGKGSPLAMGLFVDADIEGRPFDNAVTLPRSALHGQDTIYVINDDNRLEARKITIVSTARDSIMIAGGVDRGDRIVTSPLRGAGDGDPVTPGDPEAPSSGDDNANDSEDGAGASAVAAAGDGR